MVIFCLMRRLILRTNYLSKKMLNDIENKVSDLHEKFKEKFGVNKYENLVGANLYFNNIYEKSIVSSLNINGKSEQDETPTPDEPVEIKSVSGVENLFDKDNANILNAYFDTSTTSITYSDVNRILYIPCKGNTTYTISKYLTRVFNIGYTTSIPVSGVSVNGVLLGTTGTYDGTKTSMQITTGTNAKYLVVRFIQTALDTAVTEQQVLDNIMIEKGSIVHDYVPYGHWLKVKNINELNQEQSILIDMNKYDEDGNITDYYELCSIDNTKDKLNIDKDGNVSITQNIGEIVLDGSETWAYSSSNMVFYSDIIKTLSKKATTLINDYFIAIDNGTSFANMTNGQIKYQNNGDNRLIIKIDDYTDATNFKTWLSNNQVTVKYVLAEPQTISLGKITSLKLLKGINNITINDELQPSMASSINCLNLVETSLRNIKVNDYLNNKTIHLSFPFESYENIDDTEHIFIVINENLYFCYKPNHPIAPTAKHISYKYKDRYNFLYHKYNTDLNSDFNYIRYKLPEDYGKVSSINENDIFYKFVKIKDDEYKLQEYNKKTWVDNEMPYLQYIDNIEEGINNVAEILYKPSGYEYKEWTTTGYYGIKSNDYGLAQKPISSKDFDRWNKNIKLLNSIINNVINVWNLVSFIDWNEESQFEWEEN